MNSLIVRHHSNRRAFATFILLTSIGCSTATSPGDEGPTEEVPASVTTWAPAGARTVGDYDYGILPEPTGFRTMHAGTNNSDNLWVALAPQMELAWVAENSFYVPEGPTYDDLGNLYFSPLFPQEDVSLVSLNRATGERNWAIAGNGSNAGSGAVLILNDPDNPGEQSRAALARAVTDGDLDDDAADALNRDLDLAEASLSAGEFERGANDLLRVCNALTANEGGAADKN